ncbi:Sodium/sulphate symporter family-containing protein [Strongyloides ratti]|uniref:Sodium/sulphate symporter family-containing protein n=1 Tax=Strongyloides ratti TaxID=34506 RepID=A0A090MN82_STRRB|nr:Sodium/sulphate symporter family-containing protein [Strongyloides ratti]CEF59521.1 Sodium/sulphate symporter family-containing protein [Strongyloides ratti]
MIWSRKQLIVYLSPIILAWIPIVWKEEEAASAYVVLLMSVLWVTEALPLAVTSLIPIVLYPLLGVTTASAISEVYLSDSNFVFFGSLVMAMAIESCRLHERIALKICLFAGPNPRLLILGFQLATAFLSMWISNTATTAMMLPICMAVMKELSISNEEVEIEFVKDNEHNSEAKNDYLDIRKLSSDQLNLYKGLLLSISFSASIGGTGTLIGTGSNIVLSGYIERNYGQNTPVTFASWMIFAIPQLICLLTICWIVLVVLFVGFNTHNKNDDKRVKEALREKYKKLGPVNYGEKCIIVLFLLLVALWFFRRPKFMTGWSVFFKNAYVTDGTVAMAIALLLFILPKNNPFTKESKRIKNVETLMTWDFMKNKFSWSTLLLLGGGYAMAKGVEDSGLSELIGSKLSSFTSLPDWGFVAMSCILVTALTEISSNVATASIFIPLVAAIAQKQKKNPLSYIIPVAVSSSLAFMFPAGTPPNAIVFSVKALKVFDMAKAGFFLNFSGFILTNILANTWAKFIFDFDDKPGWANYNKTINYMQYNNNH